MIEFEKRVREGNFIWVKEDKNKIDLRQIDVYSNTSMPTSKSNKISIDTSNNTIILPIGGMLVPFHICTIKNVTKHAENKKISMRFNFHTPPSGNLIFPNITETHTPIYIKELTFRTTSIE